MVIGCDWIRFSVGRSRSRFKPLIFNDCCLFCFPSSEWIPMSSQKFRAKGKWKRSDILPLSTIWPCLTFNLRTFKILFYSKGCLGAGTCTIYENPKTHYRVDKKPTLQDAQMVKQLWSHMMSWKHGPKTQQGRSFAQYPMLGRHGSIRTRAAISWSRWWMRCPSTKQLMKLKYGHSMTTLRCIPVVDESQFSKPMLRIPHWNVLLDFRFKSSLGKFDFFCWHFLGPSRRRWGTNLNATKKNRLTVSTCQCTTCICYMPTRRPTPFGSTAWPRKTDGRRWWNQRTNLWRSTIHKVGQWCRKNWKI